jgi:hypothetical protein
MYHLCLQKNYKQLFARETKMKATVFTRQHLFDQCCGPAADGRFYSSDVSLAEGQRGVVSFRRARQYYGYPSGIARVIVALLGALPRRHPTQRLAATVRVRRGLPSIPAVATGKHAPDREPDMLIWYVPRENSHVIGALSFL